MSRRKKIFIGSISLHVLVLLAVFVYPLLAMKKKPVEQSSINVKVNLDQLLSTPPKTPSTARPTPPAPKEPKEDPKPKPPTPDKPEPKPEPPKPIDTKAIKERATKLKNEAISKARKIDAERQKIRDAKKNADAKKLADARAKEKAADNKKAAAKKSAAAKTQKDRAAKLKRDREAKAKKEREAKAKKDRDTKEKAAARERWIAKEAKRKAGERAAAAQKSLTNQYDKILQAEVQRLWNNNYIPNTETNQQDSVRIQVTIRRDGYVLSKKITKYPKAPQLNELPNSYMPN